jgi:hypothetical protein
MFGSLSISTPRLIDYANASAHEASIKPLVSTRNPTPIKPLAERSKRWLTIERAVGGEILIRAYGYAILTYYPDDTVRLHNTTVNSHHQVARMVTRDRTGYKYSYGNRWDALCPFLHNSRMWLFSQYQGKDGYIPVPKDGLLFKWESGLKYDSNVGPLIATPSDPIHVCLNPQTPTQVVVDRKKANALKQQPEIKAFRDYFVGAVKCMERGSYLPRVTPYEGPERVLELIKSSNPEENYSALVRLIRYEPINPKANTRTLDAFLYSTHPEVFVEREVTHGRLFTDPNRIYLQN